MVEIESAVAFAQVHVAFRVLENDIVEVVQEQHGHAESMIAKRVGHDEQDDRDCVMNEHEIVVAALRVHVDGRVDRVQVEAALDHVDERDVKWNFHFVVPIFNKIVIF